MYSKVLECVTEKVACITAGTEQCLKNVQAVIADYDADRGKFEVKYWSEEWCSYHHN